ncbi:MAG: hypothetical protein DCC52_14315 [Chloroflexi bacterium]|nr:MAG: hypothetical protein DCC52_14315 [Chloroflexota bacterium]
MRYTRTRGTVCAAQASGVCTLSKEIICPMNDWHDPNQNAAAAPQPEDNAPRGYEYDYPRPPARAAQPAPHALPERAAPPYTPGAEYNPPAYVAPTTARHANARVWLTRLGIFALGAFLFLVCGGSALIGGAYLYYANELPPADKLATVNTSQSTKIYDRHGALLYEIADPNLGRHTIIPPNKIPTVLKQATLATEDPSFYTNPGVDFYGLARAMWIFMVSRARFIISCAINALSAARPPLRSSSSRPRCFRPNKPSNAKSKKPFSHSKSRGDIPKMKFSRSISTLSTSAIIRTASKPPRNPIFKKM